MVNVVDSDVVSDEIRALLPFTKPIHEIAISENGIEIATIYSFSYFTRESAKAPRGFTLVPVAAKESKSQTELRAPADEKKFVDNYTSPGGDKYVGEVKDGLPNGICFI